MKQRISNQIATDRVKLIYLDILNFIDIKGYNPRETGSALTLVTLTTALACSMPPDEFDKILEASKKLYRIAFKEMGKITPEDMKAFLAKYESVFRK